MLRKLGFALMTILAKLSKRLVKVIILRKLSKLKRGKQRKLK